MRLSVTDYGQVEKFIGKEALAMSERDLYFMYLPQIAELAEECRQMTKESYEQWEKETLGAIPVEAIGFMEKVFLITGRHSGHGV